VSNALNPVSSSQELLYVTPEVYLPTNKKSLHLKENIQHSLNYWSLQESSELTFFVCIYKSFTESTIQFFSSEK
jgi:hypothetical protein